MTHREVSAQEAVYRALYIPMKHLSRAVVFTNTNEKNDCIAVLKNKKSLDELDDDDKNVFQKSLVDHYIRRPASLESICFAEFAANYTTDYKDDDNDDVLPEASIRARCPRITLMNNYGTRRRKEAIIRFHKYNKDSEPSNWYRSKIMYFPWRNEDSDFLEGHPSYKEHYDIVQRVILDNESKYTLTDVENIEADLDNTPQHAWNLLAPSTEANRARLAVQGDELLTEVSQQDLVDNAQVFTSSSRSRMVAIRFDSAAKSPVIEPQLYRQMLRDLNKKQCDIVLFNRSWCKAALRALKQGTPVKPYRVFLSGPGGVGKSHVIKIIHSDCIRFLKLASDRFHPDDVVALLTAPKRVAAFNISGMTIHSGFLLGTAKYTSSQALSHDKLNTLRSRLSNLLLLMKFPW